MNLRLPCSRCSSQEGSPCFSFGSNMEMLSALRFDRENEDKARLCRTNKDEYQRMSEGIPGKQLLSSVDILRQAIFGVKHNFNQVSQKRLSWNVFDYYQVRLSVERVESVLSNKMILSANTQPDSLPPVTHQSITPLLQPGHWTLFEWLLIIKWLQDSLSHQ